MTALPQKDVNTTSLVEYSSRILETASVQDSIDSEKFPDKGVWSSLFTTTAGFLDAYNLLSSILKPEEHKPKTHAWSSAVKKALVCNPMKRLRERMLGFSKTGLGSSTSEIWLLGVCYKLLDESSEASPSNDHSAFLDDFSSRIWITYRKGFRAIDDSKFTSDVNWGCMLRSSQMLVAQALLFHQLGRSWRRTDQKPFDREYINVLQLFGDSEASALSIHNLLHAGRAYGLAAGSWIGPYATCRSWENLARIKKEHDEDSDPPLPMAVYVVSGDEHGERGGAPAVSFEDADRICSEFSMGVGTWAPLLLLVPLVLGLDKVNPRYIPLLCGTFTFPQTLGILGGRPGHSTYIVGMQDTQAIYLDPHENQSVVTISKDDLEVDTSSYHCNSVRFMPMDMLDPSLAIGFYCRERSDFEDFCVRATQLANESNGAPLFTVTRASTSSRRTQTESFDESHTCDPHVLATDFSGSESQLEVECPSNEDDWQLL